MTVRNRHTITQEKGSVTVEAIISFTGFLFVLFTVLNVINFCRAQALISSAVDTAAKEMSQYAYFYKMSGLQKFSAEMNAANQKGKDNINGVVDTVTSLFGTLGEAKKNSEKTANDVSARLSEGNVSFEDVQGVLDSVSKDGKNIYEAMNSMTDMFSDIGDNPMAYIKSLVAVAGTEGMDLAKSYIIAAPLSRFFVQKQFGKTRAEADAALEKLGVVDGLDGMNFNLSTVFPSSAPEDIHIEVFYQLKLTQFFEWAEFSATLHKVAETRGWLAGDAPSKWEKKETESEPDESSAEETEAETEAETVAESTEDPTVYTWDKSSGFFAEDFENRFPYEGEEYNFDGGDSYASYHVLTGELDGGKILDLETVKFNADARCSAFLQDSHSGKKYIQILYVPENISEEAYNRITTELASLQEKYAKDAQSGEVTIEFSVEKCGGSFKYGG